jgi:hypothetical protein
MAQELGAHGAGGSPVKGISVLLPLRGISCGGHSGAPSDGEVFLGYCLVRYTVHLLVLMDWCFCFLFVDLWFVDWGWAARQKASDPNLIGEVTAISSRLTVSSTIQARVKMLDV